MLDRKMYVHEAHALETHAHQMHAREIYNVTHP